MSGLYIFLIIFTRERLVTQILSNTVLDNIKQKSTEL